MKSLIALCFGFLAPVSAFATEYNCTTAKKEVSAFLVFDDGPGGLDAAGLEILGTEFADVVFDANSKVLTFKDRDSSKGTYEYGADALEIGFTTQNNIKLDLFAYRVSKQKLTGNAVLKIPGKRSQTLGLTCLEN